MLRLFRTTGYSSLLAPGESRRALHPAWLVLAVSLWVGLACNVALWRALGGSGPALGRALALAALIAGVCHALLSLVSWRRTLKPAASLLLAAAAMAACALWSRPPTADGGLIGQGLGAFVPGWASLLRWEVPTLLVALALALVPMLGVWSTQLRRLPGPQQFAANLSGMLAGAVMALIGGVLLWLNAA